MGRRSHKQIGTDDEVHALLLIGKNTYQAHRSKRGINEPLSMADYMRAIVHDIDPEAIAALRMAARLHRLAPGDYEEFMTKPRTNSRKRT